MRNPMAWPTALPLPLLPNPEFTDRIFPAERPSYRIQNALPNRIALIVLLAYFNRERVPKQRYILEETLAYKLFCED